MGYVVAALQPCITDLRRNTEYSESFWLETRARYVEACHPRHWRLGLIFRLFIYVFIVNIVHV